MTDQKDIQALIPESFEGDLQVLIGVEDWNWGQMLIDSRSSSTNAWVLIELIPGVTWNKTSKINVRGEVIKSLEEEKAEIKAEAYRAERLVQDKIDNILQVTYEAADGS